MPACSNPPNRPPREMIDHLIDQVAWAKTCMLICAAARPGSPERADELSKLREAVALSRRAVDEVRGRGQDLPYDVLVALRVCELAIPKLEAGAILRTAK